MTKAIKSGGGRKAAKRAKPTAAKQRPLRKPTKILYPTEKQRSVVRSVMQADPWIDDDGGVVRHTTEDEMSRLRMIARFVDRESLS